MLLVLVLLAAATYLGVSRIRWGAGGSAATSTTLAGSAVGDAVLLSITQDDQTRVAVLIAPSAQPTLLVALPGDVLIRASTGFDPLRVFLDGPDEEATFQKAAEGLESMLGTRPVARADIQWSDLLKAVSSVGAGSTAPADLRSDDAKDAAVVADVLKALLAAVGTAPGDAALAALSVNGDRDAARAALRALGGAAAVSGAVPGRLVEGLGFAYFEPDVAGLQELLGGRPPESAVSVEVQNGSGVVGAAQKVSEVVSPLGYTVLPPKNAEGFPDVAITQLFAASDALAEADRLRGLLGRGTVVQQDTLPPGRVIIIVGKDLDTSALPVSGG